MPRSPRRRSPASSRRSSGLVWWTAAVAVLVAVPAVLAVLGWTAPHPRTTATGAIGPAAAVARGLERITGNRVSIGTAEQAVFGLLLAATFRRMWLAVLVRRPGPIEVIPLEAGGLDQTGDPSFNLDALRATFQGHLSSANLYDTTTVPGDPEPERLIQVLQAPAPSGNAWLNLFGLLLGFMVPTRAFIVGATLRTRDDDQMPYGVTVRVRRLPHPSSELPTEWAEDWDRVLAKGAHAATAQILPFTRACRRAPWSDWRGRELPVELFHHYQRAKQGVGERRYDDALASYRDALLADAGNIDIRYEKGQVYERLHLYLDALAVYGELTDELFPPLPRSARLRRSGALTAVLRPTPGRDPFLSRYRYIAVLGSSVPLAQQWVPPPVGQGGDADPRDWSEGLADPRQRLEWLLLNRYAGRNLDEPPARPGPDRPARRSLRQIVRDLTAVHTVDDAHLPVLRLELEEALLLCAYHEAALLRHDFALYRRWSVFRRPIRASATGTAVEVVGLLMELKLARVRHYLAAAAAGPSPAVARWDYPVESMVEELAARGYSERSPSWQDHYVAACVFSLPLIGDEEAAQHPRHAGHAVAALERALRCGDDDDFVVAKRNWMLAGDPDLAGLRRYRVFQAFEAKVYGSALPAADVWQFERFHYLALILRRGSRVVEAQWRAMAERPGTVTEEALQAWWPTERSAAALAMRLGRSHDLWQTRHAVNEAIRAWGPASGDLAMTGRYPDLLGYRTAERLLAEPDGVAAFVERIRAILAHLAAPATIRTAGLPLSLVQIWTDNNEQWRIHLSRRDTRQHGLQPHDSSRLVDARLRFWGALRSWADDNPESTYDTVLASAIALPTPPGRASLYRRLQSR